MSALLKHLMGVRGFMAPADDEGGSDAGGTGVVDKEDLETEETAVVAEGPNYLEMSDEEISKIQVPPTVAAPAKKVEAKVPATGDEVDVDPDHPDAGDDKEAKATKEPVAKATPEAAAVEDGKAKPEGVDAGEKDKPKPEVKKVEASALSLDEKAAAYDRLMAPFKANGREITPKSAEDLQALAQMGANYNKKMGAIKPHLKMLKMLENNGLLSEDKISFLIDVSKKDPNAISKLVKESGVEPLELNADKASEYKPGSHTVSDTEIDLDSTLDELKDSPAYATTLQSVTKWDARSKQVIAESPQLLKVIHSHVENGIYDRISKEVENERLFGRLRGLSDLEAYRQVGDAINAKGGFNDIGKGSSPAGGAPAAPGKVVVEAPKKVEDKDRNDKRRAASLGKSAPSASAATNTDLNPLSLSDEDFLKLATPKF
jgi:hypothetical protein